MPPRNTSITSETNDRFKDVMGLWTSKGIRRSQQCLVCGTKLVNEMLANFRSRCVAIIAAADHGAVPGSDELDHWLLGESLFRKLDQLGTHAPMLLVSVEDVAEYSEDEVLGPTVVLPLQGPENVGAAIRSAAAFGVRHVVMTDETAHPFLPRAIRASAGSVFACEYRQFKGPLSALALPKKRAIGLDGAGEPITSVDWPVHPVFVVGIEGQGLASVDSSVVRVRIPMERGVESLNATVALSICLFQWYGVQSRLPAM